MAGNTVWNERRFNYEQNYFLTQLPSSFVGGSRDYNDLEDNSMDEARKSPVGVKQSTLHLVSTEVLINRRLYGSFTILQSDF